MKLMEIAEDRAALRKARQAKLKAEIEAGNMPVVQNASGVADQSVYTMGDITDLGWSKKTYTHDSTGEVDGWERSYSGPKPFKLQTMGAKELQIVKPGTEQI